MMDPGGPEHYVSARFPLTADVATSRSADEPGSGGRRFASGCSSLNQTHDDHDDRQHEEDMDEPSHRI
jgi:hypothetical protein